MLIDCMCMPIILHTSTQDTFFVMATTNGKDTWEYKTFFANQATLISKLSNEGGLSGSLAKELLTQKIIGTAANAAANIYGPKVTEYMRLEPIVTAMLSKVELKSSRYHDFRHALLSPNVGADPDIVDKFLPETGNPMVQR